VGREFKAVFFDLDGTLIDIHGPLYAASCSAMRKLGHDQLSRERFRESLAGDDPWRSLAARHQPEYVRLLFAYLLAELDSTERLEVLPHVPETLAELKRRGYATAVITSRPGDSLRLVEKLAMAGLAPYLDQVVTQSEAKLTALDKTGSLSQAATDAMIEAADCIYVGDEPRDVMAATNAGYGASIAVATGIVGAPLLRAHPQYRPTYVIESMADLLPLLDHLNLDFRP
jgi:phosphoglycolate phosphatase-like HAD superfamily hydrolase